MIAGRLVAMGATPPAELLTTSDPAVLAAWDLVARLAVEQRAAAGVDVEELLAGAVPDLGGADAHELEEVSARG